MAITLSLDQSISCSGVVIFKDGELMHFECIKTSLEDGSDVKRISIITNRIIKLFDDYNCDSIVSEALSYGSIGNATRTLGGLLFSLEVKLYEKYGIDEIPKVAPTSVKKFATGYGGSKKKKVTKKDMFEALPEGIGQKFLDAGYLKTKGAYDLTDAWFIGKLWISQ